MICKNIELINKKIDKAARKAGKEGTDIKLIAVSKRFPAETIEKAIECGHTTFGENYVQEAHNKKTQLGDRVNIHFIGNLQSNKAKIAAQFSSMVETVDRIKIANILNNESERLQKKLDILVQVNIGQEKQKSGVSIDQSEKLIAEIQQLPHLKLCGLMTIPPFNLDAEETRPYFVGLRELSEKYIKSGVLTKEQNTLSMGMSGDFEIAIEEGATIVRVGTAIFGNRPTQ